MNAPSVRTWRLSALLVAGYWLLSFVLTHLPGKTLRAMKVHTFPHQDKLAHLLMYAGLAFLVSMWLNRNRQLSQGTIAFVLVLTAGYGALDEWLQQFVPQRTCDLLDWVADLLGVVLGLVVYGLWCEWRARRDRRNALQHPPFPSSHRL